MPLPCLNCCHPQSLCNNDYIVVPKNPAKHESMKECNEHSPRHATVHEAQMAHSLTHSRMHTHAHARTHTYIHTCPAQLTPVPMAKPPREHTALYSAFRSNWAPFKMASGKVLACSCLPLRTCINPPVSNSNIKVICLFWGYNGGEAPLSSMKRLQGQQTCLRCIGIAAKSACN